MTERIKDIRRILDAHYAGFITFHQVRELFKENDIKHKENDMKELKQVRKLQSEIAGYEEYLSSKPSAPNALSAQVGLDKVKAELQEILNEVSP